MNVQQIKQALNELADKAIPADHDPYPGMKKQLEADRRFHPIPARRVNMQKRLLSAGLIVLLAVAAGAALFFTPPGQAFAQGLYQFFTRAEGDSLSTSASQPTEPPPPTRTAAPTHIAELQAVAPAGDVADIEGYPTATPVVPGGPNAPLWNLTLDQAEQLAGYEVRVLASLPPGYRLDNVVYDPQTQEVEQFYGFHPYAAGEQFILHQRPSSPADVIGQSATVEQLNLGGLPVEYVAGSWYGENGAEAETWHPDSIHHTFRWQQGDFFFTLEILFDSANTWSPAYWTQDGMLAMVEIAMGTRAEYPEQVNLNNLTSIAQAELAAGFDLLVPSTLPEGFVFSRAVFQPESRMVRLFYRPQDGSRDSSGTQLVIVEKLGAGQLAETWEGYPQGAVETVMVGSRQATFARGSMADGFYDPEGSLYLAWDTADLSIKIIYSAPSGYPTRLDREQMIAIAESMQ
jgi:hypothetical protein